MHFKLRLIPAATAAVLLVACGGGSNPAPPVVYTPFSGVAVDGYLKFAKVVCDTNDNWLVDAAEPVVYTLGSAADSGKFTFPQGCTHGVIVSDGTNADTGLMFTGMLMAPAGATVVSPLTTLMALGMTQAQVITALGLPANTDLLHTDPLAQTDLTLFKKALVVQQLLQKSTEMFAGLTGLAGSVVMQSVYQGLAAAFATALKTGSPLISSGANPVVNVAVVQSLLTLAAQVGQQILATGLFGSAAQTALAGIDLNAMAAVVAPAMQVQAQTLLSAPAATLTSATTAAQSNTYITDYLKSVKTSFVGTPTSVTLAALTSNLTRDVTTGTSSIVAGAANAVLVTFDEPVSVFADNNTSGVYGSAVLTVGPAPAGGGSGNAMKIVKDPNKTDAYGGVYFPVPKIPFTASQKKISAQVYSSQANASILLKVQVTPSDTVEVASTPTGAANTWSTVTWDFSAVNVAKSYTTMAITPYATVAASAGTYYIDNVTLLGDAAAFSGTDYLAVADNAISLVDRGVTSNFSMTQFQNSPGISVKWPMSSPATLNVTLAEVGSFNLAPGQKLTAAIQISETSASGKGDVRAYIDNVSVSKTGSAITISVPTPASAKVYGVTSGGLNAVIDFATGVAGVHNTLTTSGINSILLGDVVNYTINNVSNDFTGITGLRGTYKVLIVVSDLPLRKADGSQFKPLTISVPTTLDSKGTPTVVRPVTGWGLEGYITLTN
jgi:hypothetical protein